MLLIIFKFSFESESRLRENLWTHTCILNIGKKETCGKYLCSLLHSNKHSD